MPRKEELRAGFLPGEGLGPPTTIGSTAKFMSAIFDSVGKTKLLIKQSPFWVGTKSNMNPNLERDIENAIKLFHECDITQKGPTQTPSEIVFDKHGKEIRSINRLLTTKLDTSICIRPIRHYSTIKTAQKNPKDYGHLVVVGDLREGLYSGSEILPGTEKMERWQKVMMSDFDFTKEEVAYTPNMGVTFKFASEEYSKRIARAGIEFAFTHKRKKATVVAKFNIMKATDAMFLQWANEVAIQEYGAVKIKDGLFPVYEITKSGHTIKFESVLSDASFMFLNAYPLEYDVLIVQNLMRDLLSDALTSKCGTLGTAPGININPKTGKILCEPVGGTGMGKDPLGEDDPNPLAAIDSFLLGIEHLGYDEEVELARKVIDITVNVQKRLTYDLARGLGRSKEESEGTTSFTKALIENIQLVA